MIGATLCRPESARAFSERVCWRCGVTWFDRIGHWLAEAPCRDCREVLSDLGEYQDWTQKPELAGPIRHGSDSGWAHGCRCDLCEVAHQEKLDARARRKKAA